MKEFPRLNFIIKNSDDDFLAKVKAFDVPKELNEINVKEYTDISIDDMLDIWDVSTEQGLYKMTAKAFLNLPETEIPELPLIDFIRLTQYTEEVSLSVGNLFKSLHREPEDIRISDILKNHPGDHFDIIARFCELFPSYTLEQAKDLSWVIIYKSFKKKTVEYDIELEKSKLK